MKALPDNPVIDLKGDQSNSQRAVGRESWTRKAQPSRPATRPNDVSKVTKFRREGKSTQLSEDKLFELLIAKVKMREEKEAIIADMKEQLEADNAQLKKENQSLRGQTKVYEEQFQNLQTQNSSQERQVGIWKERVFKFKQIVNELGHEFETLRLDSDRLRTTASSLQDERDDLSRSIEDIKLQIVRSEKTIDDQQMKLTGYEMKISELDNALLTTRDRLEETCSSLTEERKRTNLLESYIQNYSRSQIRQINLIRADNMKLLEKLTTGLENITASSSSARDAVLDEIKSAKEEAQRMLEGEKISARHEMQRGQEEQIEVMQREREKFEECSETLIGQLQGVQGSLVSAKTDIREELADKSRPTQRS